MKKNLRRHKVKKLKDDNSQTKRKRNHIETVPNKKTKSDVNNSGLKCDVCNIGFTRKDNLKRHNLKKH